AASGSNPERLPRKTPKAPKPQRHGIAYWLERDGRVLLVRRPPKGLLGGMRAFPATDFVTTPPTIGTNAPATADWQPAGTAQHGFTHFHLTVDICRAAGDADMDGEWWPIDTLQEAGLPTLFEKIRKSVMHLR
ncbi:MAG: NUDIX domain-containing protein, partial [Pseudomonadota bacterium]